MVAFLEENRSVNKTIPKKIADTPTVPARAHTRIYMAIALSPAVGNPRFIRENAEQMIIWADYAPRGDAK